LRQLRSIEAENAQLAGDPAQRPTADTLFASLGRRGVLVDVKSAVARDTVPEGINYWSL
jgi:hypothetical protein